MAACCEREGNDKSKVCEVVFSRSPVIHLKPALTPGRGANGAARQAAALRAEGVEVGRGSLGEYTVDFASHGWFPEVLPSDLAEDESSSDEEESETLPS